MAKVKITEKITPEGTRFQKALEELEKLECFIGFQHGEHTNEGVDVCDYAAFNELGTSRGIPPRPFIRNTVDLHGNEINDYMDKMVGQILNGATAEEVLRQSGIYFKGMMQTEITDGSFAPNAESTIRKKKSDKPLIDTGIMRGSINYQIKKKGAF